MQFLDDVGQMCVRMGKQQPYMDIHKLCCIQRHLLLIRRDSCCMYSSSVHLFRICFKKGEEDKMFSVFFTIKRLLFTSSREITNRDRA